MKVSSFFWNGRGLGNHKIMKMLISLLKLHQPLLFFLAEPMMSYTDTFDVLFKFVNMHLVATSPIVNKVVKFWCLEMFCQRVVCVLEGFKIITLSNQGLIT